jgi:hypothetical protein
MAGATGTQVSFDVKDDYLRVTVAGSFPATDMKDFLLTIRKKAEQCARTRLLLDALGMTPPRVEFHRYVLGELVAELFRSKYRIAFIYRPELINKFAETVANNRGAQVLATGSEVEALEWLMR